MDRAPERERRPGAVLSAPWSGSVERLWFDAPLVLRGAESKHQSSSRGSNMSDILRFACGHCGKQLSAKPQHAGRSTRCPGCKRPVTVPHPESAPIQAGNLNVGDIFAFHENIGSPSNAAEPTEPAVDELTPMFQSNSTSVASNEMISRPPPTLAGQSRQFGGVPRTVILYGGTILAAAGAFLGWYFFAGTPAGSKKPVKLAKPASIDLVKGDFDATCLAYFKQQFPDSINVDATVKFYSSVHTQLSKLERTIEVAKRFTASEATLKMVNDANVEANSLKQLLKSDTFLLREGYKLSACRLVVAQRRFEHNKAAVNRANTPEKMKACSEAMKADEALVKLFQGTQNVLGNRMTEENLDTTAIRNTAGLD